MHEDIRSTYTYQEQAPYQKIIMHGCDAVHIQTRHDGMYRLSFMGAVVLPQVIYTLQACMSMHLIESTTRQQQNLQACRAWA